MGCSIRLCVNTQTPFVRFKLSYSELINKYRGLKEPLHLSSLVQGEDYEFTPGGVTAIVFSLLKRLMQDGLVVEPKWVALAPNAPSEVVVDGIRLHNITMEEREIRFYTLFKEGIWNELHGLGRLHFDPQEYRAYVTYNWLSASSMLELLSEVDLFFIHDFQQLLIGNILSPCAPALFQWHIPFQLEGVSERLRALILKCVEGFDAIIVSTRRDLEGLINAGYRGKAHQVYPYIDPSKWRRPSKRSLDLIAHRYSLKEDDPMLLVVGRMDRIKSQDIAIKALAALAREFPNLQLVLVGDGSFTASGAGGLSHPKALNWRAYLERLAHKLGVRERVIFTGHVSDEAIRCLYSLATVVLVPSRMEGFNLTTIEGWMYKKPVVVSDGAGSSELVNDKVNGYVFAKGDDRDLAQKVRFLLTKPDEAERMGENGLESAKQCFVDAALSRLKEIFEQCLSLYGCSRSSLQPLGRSATRPRNS